MLRINGKFIVYYVQHAQERANGTDSKWVHSSMDYFGRQEIKAEMAPFQASGRCWQQIGLHASYIEADAHRLASAYARMHPGTRFRVMKAVLVQETGPVDDGDYFIDPKFIRALGFQQDDT